MLAMEDKPDKKLGQDSILRDDESGRREHSSAGAIRSTSRYLMPVRSVFSISGRGHRA